MHLRDKIKSVCLICLTFNFGHYTPPPFCCLIVMTYHYSNITVESSVNEKRVDVSGSVATWNSFQEKLVQCPNIPPIWEKSRQNIQPLILRSSMSGRLMEGFSLIH